MVQYEKLQPEAATLPGIRAELEALRRRHTAALELMGERDEEVSQSFFLPKSDLFFILKGILVKELI